MNIHRAGFEGMGRLTRWVNVDYLRKMMINLNPNGDLMIIAFKAFEFWPIFLSLHWEYVKMPRFLKI